MQYICYTFFQICIEVRRTQLCQIIRHSSNVFRNRHMIIIQYNDKILFKRGCIIQCFICHPTCQRPISDYRDHTVIFPLQISCAHIPKPRRDRSRAVSGVKCIACTFFSLRESAHPAIFSQVIKSVFSSGQDLMCIGLMSYIPYNFILRQIKDQMHCHCKFYYAEIRCQMSSGFTDLLDQELSDLLCQFRKFFRLQIFYIICFLNSF